MKYSAKTMKSPVGDLTLVVSEDKGKWKLSAVLWKNEFQFRGKLLTMVSAAENAEGGDGAKDLLKVAEKQLTEYFKGDRKNFELPLRVEGTDFQKRVWATLQKIRYGQTISYGDLAKRAGFAGAFRATGATVGMNPFSIIVPCHRVLGANGDLTGFAGGLKTKVFLLEHEGFSDFKKPGSKKLKDAKKNATSGR